MGFCSGKNDWAQFQRQKGKVEIHSQGARSVDTILPRENLWSKGAFRIKQPDLRGFLLKAGQIRYHLRDGGEDEQPNQRFQG